MTVHRSTDEMSELDMRQLLLFEEGLRRHEPVIGRAGARQRAADETPLVFDSETLEAAARGDPLLPSIMAAELSWVAQRSDWGSPRQRFADETRDAHVAQAERRRAERDRVRGAAG